MLDHLWMIDTKTFIIIKWQEKTINFIDIISSVPYFVVYTTDIRPWAKVLFTCCYDQGEKV